MQTIKYPCVYQHTPSGLVVRFTANEVGTVIETVKGEDEIGTYNEDWTGPEMESWVPYKPKVSLKEIYENY